MKYLWAKVATIPEGISPVETLPVDDVVWGLYLTTSLPEPVQKAIRSINYNDLPYVLTIQGTFVEGLGQGG